MDCLFNVHKPMGPTSHDVVARIRRASGVKRVGHAGTLDPLAEGVLIVAVGQATRVIEYLADADKAYRAQVTLGIETDTYDAEGQVVAERPAGHLTRVDVEAALAPFRGRISQRPPAYSAISVGGTRLYERARRGEAVDVPVRDVEITTLELEDWAPPVATLHVDCSKGTYIRSLAHDLGAALGTGGHLSRLLRLRVCSFQVDDAVPLATLEEQLRTGEWRQSAIAPEAAIAHLPAVRLDAAAARRVANGIAISLDADAGGEAALAAPHDTSNPPGSAGVGTSITQPAAGSLTRVFGPDGAFLAVARLEAHDGRVVLRPEKVFASDTRA